MTRDELARYAGYTVEINVDGVSAIGTLDSRNPENATLIIHGKPNAGTWEDIRRHKLADGEIATLSAKGHNHLASCISISALSQ